MEQNQTNPQPNREQPVQSLPIELETQTPIQPNQMIQTKSKQNLLLYIIILILLTVIGRLSWYIFQQQSRTETPKQQKLTETIATPTATSETMYDQTSDWKMYIHDQFSIKYPPTWKLEENYLNTGAVITSDIPSDLQDENGDAIYYRFDVQIDSIDNFNSWSTHPTTEVIANDTINGNTFQRFIVEDMYSSLNYTIPAISGDVFRLYVWPYDQNQPNQQIENYVTQVLSTLEIDGISPFNISSVFSNPLDISDWQSHPFQLSRTTYDEDKNLLLETFTIDFTIPPSWQIQEYNRESLVSKNGWSRSEEDTMSYDSASYRISNPDNSINLKFDAVNSISQIQEFPIAENATLVTEFKPDLGSGAQSGWIVRYPSSEKIEYARWLSDGMATPIDKNDQIFPVIEVTTDPLGSHASGKSFRISLEVPTLEGVSEEDLHRADQIITELVLSSE